jgi:hypothetical protein
MRSSQTDGIEQILRCFRVADQSLGQMNSEGAIEPKQKLRACQAVEAEIAIEVAVEPDDQPPTHIRMEFEDKLADCRDELGPSVVGGRLVGRIHPSCPLAQTPLRRPGYCNHGARLGRMI